MADPRSSPRKFPRESGILLRSRRLTGFEPASPGEDRMTALATMEKASHYQLRLAERMSRLGTETAFEVLNKARALERQGKDIVHLEIGEPDFDTPKDIVDAG